MSFSTQSKVSLVQDSGNGLEVIDYTIVGDANVNRVRAYYRDKTRNDPEISSAFVKVTKA